VLLTLGVLQALHERRTSWPEDIALVGYADARWAAALVPPLTAIEQPVEQLGEMAVSLLLQARQTRANASSWNRAWSSAPPTGAPPSPSPQPARLALAALVPAGSSATDSSGRPRLRALAAVVRAGQHRTTSPASPDDHWRAL